MTFGEARPSAGTGALKLSYSIPCGAANVNPLRQSLLNYRGQGLAVIPVVFGGKQPKVPWKEFQERLPTTAEIDRWCRRFEVVEDGVKEWHYPIFNLGLVCGRVSGCIVTDVDIGRGGLDTLNRLQRQNEPLPETVEVVTPSGGRHVYFRHPGVSVSCSVDLVGGGLDVRGDGGIAVVPPSINQAGCHYRFEGRFDEVEIAECPAWLLDLILGKGERLPPSEPSAPPTLARPPRSSDELQEYLRLLPGLKRLPGGYYLCRCRFHDDHSPSFTVSYDEKARLWRWRCWACCPGSAIRLGEAVVHHGNLDDLKLKLGLPVGPGRALGGFSSQPEKRRAPETIIEVLDYLPAVLPEGSPGLRTGEAILHVAAEHEVNLLHHPVLASRRRIAEVDAEGGAVGNRAWIEDGIKQLKQVGVSIGGKQLPCRERPTATFRFDKLLARAVCVRRRPGWRLLSEGDDPSSDREAA